ncbi:hypothetical protein BDM02DRAFT_3129539, partial [Thelephora ganbajun]
MWEPGCQPVYEQACAATPRGWAPIPSEVNKEWGSRERSIEMKLGVVKSTVVVKDGLHAENRPHKGDWQVVQLTKYLYITCSLMTNSRKTPSRSSTSAKRRVQGLLDNPPSQESIRAEVQLVVDNGNIGVIRELGTKDQARFLEIVDQATPAVLVEDTQFVAALGDISSNILLLPTSTGLLQGLKKRGDIAVASGGTTDIWRGAWGDKP